ncbi:MAG: DUF3393 domain-containing protein [Alphaproteobacteria bacterium]|nr:DUF3393 domain-containing protein [Alphaproteobacteria bacterium]
MRRRSVLGALVGLAAAPALAQGSLESLDKALDQLEKSLDKSFDKLEKDLDAYFAKLEKDLEATFAEFEKDLDRNWGQSKRISTAKQWVGYSDQLQTRVTVDYEKGEVTLESTRSDLDQGQLQTELRRLLEADDRVLNDRDEIAKRMKRKMDTGGLATPPAKPVPPQQQRRQEIGALTEPARSPQFTTERINDGQGRPVEVKRLTVPFNANAERLNAERLRQPVEHYADQYKLPRALVLSIIKNESAFNPRAQSPIPAFGLMQLVPSSAGKDVWLFLNKKPGMPTPEYLFRPLENVEMGATYLHLLNSRYLEGIQNQQSRLYCVISAYNTGAGNVARSFVGSTNVDAAERQINRMQPEQVYDHLIQRLPHDETRQYLRKVRRDMETFRDWDVRRG